MFRFGVEMRQLRTGLHNRIHLVRHQSYAPLQIISSAIPVAVFVVEGSSELIF